jgi:hypothetical protein
VTLSNTGSAALTISSIGASGDFAQSNTCGASVAAGASCTVQVTFTPTAIGQRAGTLTIADNAAPSPQSVSLSGIGDNGVTPTGTYQIGVIGTAGALVQASTVTVIVQ